MYVSSKADISDVSIFLLGFFSQAKQRTRSLLPNRLKFNLQQSSSLQFMQ
jgi:hypothetical protein